MYLFSLMVVLSIFFFKKPKIFKFYKILLVVIGLFCYLATFLNTIMIENIHNLTYDSYATSFKKTLKILEKEYVLNNHKNIDYDYLYNKYYSNIEKAELNSDEQLYYKTMFEFSKEFKDGHFGFSIYYTNLEDTIKRYEFSNDYLNRNYGFGTVLLSNNEIVAILVDEDSEAYQQGLRDGMRITKKDQKDILKLLDEVITPMNAYPVYEDESLINSFYLFATGNNEIEVSFIDELGEEKTISIKAIDKYNDKPDILWERLFYYDTNLENLATKMLDKNTGYIYIDSEMYSPIKGAFGYLIDDSWYLTKIVDKKLSDLKEQGMENLIIDLRANTGGYETESSAIARLFTSDSYTMTKSAKGNSKLYDYARLKGNGKYENIKSIVLVNSDTASAGDLLADMLSKCPNTTLIGFTNSNNSAQSIGGMIYLPKGTSYISYPIYTSYNIDGTIQIDPDARRLASVKVDERIKLTKDNISNIIYSDEDYLLNYAINLIDN